MDNMSGANWVALGTLGSGVEQFNSPAAVAVDATGHIYVADYLNNRIVRFLMP
jgi:DNA-binding beta-propeller fold protein YncE